MTTDFVTQFAQDMETLRRGFEMHVRAIQERLEEIDEERHQLQEMLGSYETVLRSLNGEEAHEAPERRPGERLQAVAEWMWANRGWLNEGQGFSVPTLFREHGDAIAMSPLPTNQSSLAKILRELHSEGTIRLVSQAIARGPRGEKFYKVN